MNAGANPLRDVTRWRGGRYAIDGGGRVRPQQCGRAEAQRTVRAALRAGLHVTAVAGAGVMVVTVGPARRWIYCGCGAVAVEVRPTGERLCGDCSEGLAGERDRLSGLGGTVRGGS